MSKIMTEIARRGFIDAPASMRLPSPLRTGRRMPPLKYPRWALTLLATAQLIIALDATIIFVALHDMGRALQINAQQLQWVVSAYTVAFGGCLLLGGRLGDLYGHRRLFLAGITLFTIASLACGLANTQGLLVAALE